MFFLLYTRIQSSAFCICASLFSQDSTLPLLSFYFTWAKRRKVGQSKGWFCPPVMPWWYRHLLSGCVSDIWRAAGSGLLLWDILALLEAEKYNSASGFLFPGDWDSVSGLLGSGALLIQCDCLTHHPLPVVSLVKMFPINCTTNKRKSK